MILLRPICWWLGHKRGVLKQVDLIAIMRDGEGFKIFACPRCHRETRYKVRQPLPGNGTSGEEA